MLHSTHQLALEFGLILSISKIKLMLIAVVGQVSLIAKLLKFLVNFTILCLHVIDLYLEVKGLIYHL